MPKSKTVKYPTRLVSHPDGRKEWGEVKPKPKPAAPEAILAAEQMDWQQVILNGGPPCFHICDDGRFCGRAERWAGHEDLHKFVSLANLLHALNG